MLSTVGFAGSSHYGEATLTNSGQTDGFQTRCFMEKLWVHMQICVVFAWFYISPYAYLISRLVFFGGPRTCLGKVSSLFLEKLC
jgi:hypothetical protein